MERHQRLKQARQRRFATAKAASDYLRIPYGTLTGHESGARGIKDEQLELYASVYRVYLPWLKYELGPEMPGQGDAGDQEWRELFAIYEEVPKPKLRAWIESARASARLTHDGGNDPEQPAEPNPPARPAKGGQ